MSTQSYLPTCLLLVMLPVTSLADETSGVPTVGEKLFALNVKALLAQKCNACHGDDPDKVEGDFNMLSRDAMLVGGEAYAGKVLIPGKGKESFLYQVTTRSVEGYEMPPKEAERLTEEQSRWIRDWINADAPWPDDKRVAEIQQAYAEGEIVATSGGLGDAWTNRRYKTEHLWAYRPLQLEAVPDGAHPVDWFINRRLREVGLEPAPAATPRELARRLSFGLTGLPAADPAKTDQFAAEFPHNQTAAVKNYAGELMASHHYGEHFGRQWLDVARYADSAGFANDYSRPNVWRYRDYVVRAFNNDKPYHEFIRQQIAGDEINPSDPENIVATGFLRMGAWEQTGMSVFRLTRQQWLDDVTDSVGQTFLAHPLQCAKCHDHKFDPIPTRDYYRMMAVFSTTQFAEPDTEFLDSENRTGFDSAQNWTRAKLAAYRQQKNELEERMQSRRKAEDSDAKVGENGLNPGDEASLARIRKNISRHTWELDKTKPIAFAVYTGKEIERNNVSNRIALPKTPWAAGQLEEDTILTGGDAFTRGDVVQPAALSAATNLGQMPPYEFPSEMGKRRLALANWIVDRQNPLTARVMVNRVWTWHFGKGIAGNPNNFGATGSLPTHPELLDYLADWFVQHDWSVKALNELILTSETWRRSSRHPNPAAVAEKDPKGEFYAVQRSRRLTAEELRDAMLLASGELNPQLGGIPCRPDINMEVAMQPRQIMGGTASVYEPDPLPQQRNRRSLYAEKIRGLRDPFSEAFNQPGPDKSCEIRDTSTVAPQALTLFNAVEVHDRALAFAATLLSGDAGQTDPQRIQRAFIIALGRSPTSSEVQTCLDHWTAATQEESQQTHTLRIFNRETQRTVMAEKTGEPYDFVEIMPAYETYIHDLQPAQADARTRGLAQVCLVIFNLNEFAYLD